MDSNKQLGLQNLPGHNDFEITRFDYLLCLFLNMWFNFRQKPACLGKSLKPFPPSLAFPSLWGQGEEAQAGHRLRAISLPGVL